MRKAIYAGSFDPLTYGHQYIIEEALVLFDELVIAVAVNPDKKGVFSAAERVEMVTKVVQGVADKISFNSMIHGGGSVKFKVVELSGEYVVRYAAQNAISYLVRGVRSVADFEYERTIRHVNASLAPVVSTILMMPPKHLEDISSSFVKGMVGPVGWRRVVPSYVAPVVYAELEKRFARKRWETFCAREPKGVHSWFHPNDYGFMGAYYQPHRAYHTMDHILHCLEELDAVRDLCKRPEFVEAAIWFHDHMYETSTGRTNNEECSVSSMQVLAGHDDTMKDAIGTMILSTKTHEAIDDEEDTKLFLDIDMAVLGQSEPEYMRYANGVKFEYKHVPEREYTAGRGLILRGFLDRERIYLTDHFHQKYEKTARANIAKELLALAQLGA